MPGLSAKVFRTYNASYTMSDLLTKLKDTNITMQEKVKLYNDCNRKVAILCNHKRTVGAGHEAQMEKMTDRVSRLYPPRLHQPKSNNRYRSRVSSINNGV